MQLHHEFVVPLGIEEAWEAFNDLERIGPAFPGAAVTGVTGDDFTGTAKVKLGPISLQYTGTGRFASRDAAGKRAVIEASGTDRRGNGTAGATITASLQAEGEGSTRVLLDTDLKITGRPAQFGRGVIQDVGGKILDQFAANLTTLLGGSKKASTGAPAQPVDDSPVEETPAEAAAAESDAAARAGVVEPGAAEAAPATAPAPQRPVSAVKGTAGTSSAGRPAAGRPAAGGEPEQLDLGSVVGPALLQRYGVTVAAVVVTAVVTWVVARRRS
jgi:carbon monoxide dehydrogenase subunit G